MNTQIDDLKTLWNKAKSEVPSVEIDTKAIVSQANAKRRSSVVAHILNMAILAVTLVVITLYYFFVMRYSFMLSHVGFGIMFVSLALRIVVEVVSMVRARRISITDSALLNTQQTVLFVKQRRRIHGPYTIAIVACYVLGFALMGPEIYHNLPFYIFVGIYLFFVVGAFVLIVTIRRGIRKELNSLQELLNLRNELCRD
ncbi:MAG: hypothetical protein RBS81_14005 [Tenuifilaceae bacterium]|jgi:hypothetical protein|nr:hypothetical protein [Tenuifilaceae bacterium]